MIEILKLLKKDPTEVVMDDLKKRLEVYYSNNTRHSYSKISEFIYSECEDGDFEYITENLGRVILDMKQEGNAYLDKVNKLMDHIELESHREAYNKAFYMNYTQKLMREQRHRQIISIGKQKEELLVEIENAKREFSNDFENQKTEIDKLNGNIVSVLGIFGAIIMAFFGGLSFLGGVLNNMHNVSAYRLIFIGLIFLVGLFNIIFLLFFCIAKLLNKNLWSSCSDCSTCTMYSKSSRFKCLQQKYPLLMWYNSIGIFLLLSDSIIYALDKYNICSIILQCLGINSNNGLGILICGAIIYLIIISIIILLIFLLTFLLTKLTNINNSENCKFINIKFKDNTAVIKLNENELDVTLKESAADIVEDNKQKE